MKAKRRYILILIVLITMLVYRILTTEDFLLSLRYPIFGLWSFLDISCYEQTSTKDSLPIFNETKEKEKLSRGKNIFFHETSCFGENGAEINCRQACAVESAAKMNPGMSVYLFYLSPSGLSKDAKVLIDQLKKYDNFQINRIFFGDFIKETPIEKWYSAGILKKSYWPRSHMSDIVRYLTLWKYAGIYLDLDVVLITSFEDLEDFTGAEDHINVAAGVIGFSKSKLGRKLANVCLKDLVENFRGDIWGNNGPLVMTRVLRNICGVTYAKDMGLKNCEGFQVFPSSTFYPILYNDWRNYFETNNLNDTMAAIKKARAIHVWNNISKSEIIKFGIKVPYTMIAETYCPRVYNICRTYF